MQLGIFLFFFVFQNKYKEAGKKELVRSLYSLLPETKETQHAKELTQLYSEVDLTHNFLLFIICMFYLRKWSNILHFG